MDKFLFSFSFFSLSFGQSRQGSPQRTGRFSGWCLGLKTSWVPFVRAFRTTRNVLGRLKRVLGCSCGQLGIPRATHVSELVLFCALMTSLENMAVQTNHRKGFHCPFDTYRKQPQQLRDISPSGYSKSVSTKAPSRALH